MAQAYRGERALLSVEGIRKYARNLLIFSGVYFEVHEGELLGLVAPGGIAADEKIDIVDSILRPDGGIVRFKGENITGLKPHQVAAKGLVRTFREPLVFKDMTVLESVVIAHHLHFKLPWWRTIIRNNQDNREATQSASEILDFLGILPLKDLKTKDLRYDQKRTVGIAVALAARPELVILDQPPIELSLDEIDLIKVLAKRVRSRGVTVVMLARTPTVLEDACDRVVSMSDDGSRSFSMEEESADVASS